MSVFSEADKERLDVLAGTRGNRLMAAARIKDLNALAANLGAASRAIAGLPVSAQIEEGNNANGDYVRLSAGSSNIIQFCWHAIVSDVSADITWTFPSEFAGTDIFVSVVPLKGSGLQISVPIIRSPDDSTVDFSVVDITEARVARTCLLFATGAY